MTPYEIEKAKKARLAGYSWVDIAMKLGRSPDSVKYYVKKVEKPTLDEWWEEGTVYDKSYYKEMEEYYQHQLEFLKGLITPEIVKQKYRDVIMSSPYYTNGISVEDLEHRLGYNLLSRDYCGGEGEGEGEGEGYLEYCLNSLKILYNKFEK